MYELRDASGTVVGRAKSWATAHRALRRRGNVGGHLNRADAGRDFPVRSQSIYESGREEGYAKIGERHGYTGLAHGVAKLLRAYGLEYEPLELTNRFHNQLVGMADQADRITVQQIAREFDARMTFSSVLPYEVDRSDRFYPPYYSHSSVDVGWIQSEIAKKLREEKIRRGTKKYKEFVARNAQRVVDAVRDAVRNRAEKEATAAKRWAAEKSGDVDKVARDVAHFDELERIDDALWRAAELPGEPPAVARIRERRAAYERALARMRSVLASAESTTAEVDEEDVRYGLQQPELKPFADALGMS